MTVDLGRMVTKLVTLGERFKLSLSTISLCEIRALAIS